MTERLCIICGAVIPKSRRLDAKKCRDNCDSAERQRRYSERHPGRTRNSWRKYSRTPKGTITVLLNSAKDRARDFNLPFTIDRDFVEEKIKPWKCELTGIKFERFEPGKCRTHPYTPSLDRKIPALGYTKENTRIICFAVNRALSDWGDEVLLRIAKGLLNNFRKDVHIMAKKQDLKFANESKFLADNPHFSVTKVEPNYPAIRAVLRSGSKLEGVELVDVEPATDKATDKPKPDAEKKDGAAPAHSHKTK